jgi:hypothetical protein
MNAEIYITVVLEEIEVESEDHAAELTRRICAQLVTCHELAQSAYMQAIHLHDEDGETIIEG